MPASATTSVPSNASRQYGVGIPAVILYPALGAPTYVGEKNSLHLLLLAKDGLTAGEVNRHLKVLAKFDGFRNAKKNFGCLDVPDLLCQSSSSIIIQPYGRMAPITAMSQLTAAIAPAVPPQGLIENGLIEIPEIGFRGYLNHLTLAYWRGESGLQAPSARSLEAQQLCRLHHIRIALDEVNPISRTEVQADRFFLHWMDLRKDVLPSQSNAEAPPLTGNSGFHQEAQEKLLYQILQATKSGAHYDFPQFLGERLWGDLRGHAGSSPSLSCLNPNGLDFDDNVLLTDYHPVYWKRQKAPPPPRSTAPVSTANNVVDNLNFGVISDLHLVTKFQLLKHSEITVIPNWPASFGKEEAALIPGIGGLISDTVGVLEGHFDRMRNDAAVDAVFVVGDLIDFHRDNYPTSKTVLGACPPTFPAKLAAAKAIWEATRVPRSAFDQSTRDRITAPNYQNGTSYLGVFHLVADFVLRCGKPVFMLAGNHDGYDEPFGISPRVAFDTTPNAKEFKKANEGIACDTNLTILEAATVFGPTYGSYSKMFNFNADVLQLFHILFCPFRSWTLEAGKQQQLVFLEWGADEAMLGCAQENDSTEVQGGHLPHANLSLKSEDIGLLEQVVGAAQGKSVILISHFTYACYSPKVPLHTNDQLTNNLGAFPKADVSGLFGATHQMAQGIPRAISPVTRFFNLPNDNNYGTFHFFRERVFDLIKKGPEGGIAMTISGHAHRAAIYTPVNLFPDQPVPDSILVCGWHFDDYATLRARYSRQCLMVVSDSAGPIPRKNQDNELEGWGSQRPSWTKIVYGQRQQPESITSVYSDQPNARPRLGVTLDYLESTIVKMARLAPSDNLGTLGTTFANFLTGWAPKIEIQPAVFPDGLYDASDKPLWIQPSGLMECPSGAYREPGLFQTAPSWHQPLGANFAIKERDKFKEHAPRISPDRDEDEGAKEEFGAEILTAFVSERISASVLDAIKFYQAADIIALPEGYSFKGADVFWRIEDDPGTFKWVRLGMDAEGALGKVRNWTMRKANSRAGWDAIAGKLDKQRRQMNFASICGDAWIRYSFAGSGSDGKGEYNSAAPWIVRCKAGIYPVGGKWRFAIYRDMLGNERPDHTEYDENQTVLSR